MKQIKKLSVIVPVYNEEKTVDIILKRLFAVNFGIIKLEVVVVNDGSIDKTLKVLEELKKKYKFKLISYKKNVGKTFALKKGFLVAKGDVIVVQDGDLEYEPRDLKKLLEKISKEGVRVVYGSRLLGVKKVNYSGLDFYIGGIFLTYLTNILYKGHITDEPTGYKMFDSSLLKSIKIKSNRFEFCPEVTAKVLKRGIEIYEVPISYTPRHRFEGKKIKMRDFLEAVWTLLKYRFVD